MADLLIDLGAIDTPQRSIAWIMLCDPEAKALFETGWSREAKHVVEQFRAAHDLFENDPAFVDLATQLGGQSAKFRQWWAEHDIATSNFGTKTISRKDRTDTWAHHSFQSNKNPDLRLVVYVGCCWCSVE